MSRVRDGPLQLHEQRLEANPELQRGLTSSTGVEVGPGTQEQDLARVELPAPAQRGRHPSLRREFSLALAPARGAAGPDVDLAGSREATVSEVLAVAEADPYGHRSLRHQPAAVRIGGRARLCMQGAIEEPDPLGDEDVHRVLYFACLLQPARCVLLRRERGERSYRGGSGKREGGGFGVRLGLPRASAASRRGPRRPQRL